MAAIAEIATAHPFDDKINDRRRNRILNMLEWLEPWSPIDDEKRHRELEAELAREIGVDHVLHGIPATAIGQRADQDDVLFLLEDGRVAEVHLTWRGSTEIDEIWPRTMIYASREVWAELSMKRHHDDFTN